jgi:hypothetical protein
MKAIVIAGAVLLMGVGSGAYAEEPALTPPKKIPAEYTIKVEQNGEQVLSDDDIAEAIADENAKRDPVAQEHAKAAKREAEESSAHDARKRKVCDNIPEDAMRNDPSLRRMCQ